ncbi:MAG: hypothetical protein IPH62_15720 [Ignavibacteriae bacterium]|nr:hypothetical protein [Ignavibacteriota bacterium]
MKTNDDNDIINWLLKGDVSIQYQVYRDLLNTENPDLRNRISKEGWGKKYLSLQNKDGHWGQGFYQPKWTSTHYTLLELKNLSISQNIKSVQKIILSILKHQKGTDGGINPAKTMQKSDVCICGMFLNYASYFKLPEEELKSIVDFLLTEKMNDGGFNCHSNRIGAIHSSLHTTLSVLEGILEYKNNGYKYRLDELLKAEKESIEFILLHKLFKSHRTGEIIKKQFLSFSYPPRWYYDILRCLDYFYFAKVEYDDRMKDAIDIIIKKKRKDGKWLLQQNHKGETYFEMEKVGEPSRWNTLRALRILNFYNKFS